MLDELVLNGVPTWFINLGLKILQFSLFIILVKRLNRGISGILSLLKHIHSLIHTLEMAVFLILPLFFSDILPLNFGKNPRVCKSGLS